jgi:hypothetical protein
MNHRCLHCDCSFPDDSPACLACGEPNPIWETREREKSLIGYESARPFEFTVWTGVPKVL